MAALKRELPGDPWIIVCSKCRKQEESPDIESREDAMDYADAIGWLIAPDRALCPACCS